MIIGIGTAGLSKAGKASQQRWAKQDHFEWFVSLHVQHTHSDGEGEK